MKTLAQPYAVEHDGRDTHDLPPPERVLLERIARCGYMIDRHREGIAINSQRIAEAQAELRRLEVRP